MSHHNQKKLELQIHGMHCASCEVLIERQFKKVEGVEHVEVNHATGKAEVQYAKKPDLQALQEAVKEHGYAVSSWADRHRGAALAQHTSSQRGYLEIGAVFLILVAVYFILKQFDLVPKLGITETMSYGFVFAIGLVAAMSTCLAVTGGLLIALAAKYNEMHPNRTAVQRFKPHLYFNAGRIVGYTAFGTAIGALGSVLTLSPRINGLITIVASLVMIILGFQLLHLFPGLKRFQPKMPKFLAHKIHDATNTAHHPTAPFFLGASTFFLPCGFTQALQLYVLSKGDWRVGALTMLAFSLGTLPALMSLGALSSFVKGAFQRYFLKFAGALVILLGLFNINNGLNLTGTNISWASFFQSSNPTTAQAAGDPNVQLVDGKQVVNMKVVWLSYTPHQFTVQQGIPVEWRIDGTQAQGCAQVITVPRLGITKYISPSGITTVSFTPQQTGTIPFSCTMGMTTRGSAFTVVPNTTGIVGAKSKEQPANNASGCNPEISNCVPAQKVSMEVSQERGIYPRTLPVRKGIPVDLTIDSKVPLGGCMSVWVIPQYNVTIPMKVGITKATFTPTEAGTIAMTCGMGSKMAEFIVS